MSERAHLTAGDGLELRPGRDFTDLTHRVLASGGETGAEERILSLGTYFGGIIARNLQDGPMDIMQTIARRFGEQFEPPLEGVQMDVFLAGVTNAALIRREEIRLQGMHGR